MIKKISFLIFVALFANHSYAKSTPPSPLPILTFLMKPYSGPYIEGHGLCTMIINKVFQQTGLPVSISFDSFKNAIQRFNQTGTIGVYPIYPSKGLLKNFMMSDPLMPIKFYLYSSAETAMTLAFEGAETAPSPHQSNVLCTSKGFKALPEIQDYIQNSNFKKVLYEDYISYCFFKMKTGRVTHIIAEERSAKFAQYFLTGTTLVVKKSPESLFESALYFVLPATLPEASTIMAKFNETLANLKASGTIDLMIAEQQEVWDITE